MAKKALLVGINDYRQINDLSGCINDVTNVRDILLKYFGFTVPAIRLLVDSRATKANIMSRLHWLVTGAKRGDVLVFHFRGTAPASGTGTAMSSKTTWTRPSARGIQTGTAD